MKRISILLTSVAVAGLMLAGATMRPEPRNFCAITSAARVAAPDTFRVDGVHSTVIFRIEHMGIAPFYGRFNEISGEFTFDESNPASASFNITIKTGSVDTNNEGRDTHLKSDDFFDAAAHPDITFTSTSVIASDDGKLDVTGDLSLHGVTQAVTFKVISMGTAQSRQSVKRGFDVQTTIKRSDFSIGEAGGLGDEVALLIGLEGARIAEGE